MSQLWYLYIVQNKFGHLYTGITTDVTRRVAQHDSGRGAKALKGKGPITLLWSGYIGDRSHASKAEYWLKSLSRAQKFAFISGTLCLPDFKLEQQEST